MHFTWSKLLHHALFLQEIIIEIKTLMWFNIHINLDACSRCKTIVFYHHSLPVSSIRYNYRAFLFYSKYTYREERVAVIMTIIILSDSDNSKRMHISFLFEKKIYYMHVSLSSFFCTTGAVNIIRVLIFFADVD